MSKGIAGLGIANPTAVLLSASMMLRHLQLHSFSDRCAAPALVSLCVRVCVLHACWFVLSVQACRRRWGTLANTNWPATQTHKHTCAPQAGGRRHRHLHSGRQVGAHARRGRQGQHTDLHGRRVRAAVTEGAAVCVRVRINAVF